MARVSTFKKGGGGGGFLNAVDVTILNYRFTDEFRGEPFDPKRLVDEYKNGKKTGKKVPNAHKLFLELEVMVDGAEESIKKELSLSNDYDAWEITDDEKTVAPLVEGMILSENAAGCKFIQSLVDAGYPVENESYDVGTLNFEPMVGLRAHLIQREDVERTNKFGGVKSKKDPNKEFPRTDLVVERVLAGGVKENVAGAKTAAKAPVKGAVKAATKPNGKLAKPSTDEDELYSKADDALCTILMKMGADKKAIGANKTGVQVLTLLKGDPQRQDIYKLFGDDAYLGREQGWSFDAEKRELSL